MQFNRQVAGTEHLEQNAHALAAWQAHIEDTFVASERTVMNDDRVTAVQLSEKLPAGCGNLFDPLANGMDERIGDDGSLSSKGHQSARKRHPLEQ